MPRLLLSIVALFAPGHASAHLQVDILTARLSLQCHATDLLALFAAFLSGSRCWSLSHPFGDCRALISCLSLPRRIYWCCPLCLRLSKSCSLLKSGPDLILTAPPFWLPYHQENTQDLFFFDCSNFSSPVTLF